MVDSHQAVWTFDAQQRVFSDDEGRRARGAISWKTFAPLAFFLAATWPLILFPDPAMQDYPNHLARAFILLHPDNQVLRHAYGVHWSPIPDLGWDIWAVSLGQFVPLHLAALLFFVFYFGVSIGGLLALNRAFGNPYSPVPLVGVPFLMNGGYTKGFLNFDLGMALMLWALAAWVWLGDARWRLRLVVGIVFSTLLYIIHFYAFAVYGLFLLGLELPARWKEGWRGFAKLGRDGLQAIPAFVLLAAAGRNTNLPSTFYERPWHRLVDLNLLIDTNHTWLNIILLGIIGGWLIFAIAQRQLGISARLVPPLLLCVLIFATIPDSIFGTAYVAWRTMLAAALVGIAALSPRGRGDETAALIAAALLVTLLNSALSAVNAARGSAERRDFLAVISPMRVGGRLFWAHSGGTQHALLAHDASAYHLGSEAVEAREAVVQSMFAYPGQQILEFRDPALKVPNNSETFLNQIADDFHKRHASLSAYVRSFDYVLLEGPGDRKAEASLPLAQLRLINQVGDFRLYAVRPRPVDANDL